jgi:choline dehydrogenase
VGAGSAGCVLANRLSADPHCKVTLIEAGGWDRSVFVRMPAGYFALMKTGHLDWGYHSVPQGCLDGRALFLPRGRVVGGSSSVNGMVYVRGHPTDFDRWQQLGNRGWSYDDCLPYFKKAENFQGPKSEYRGSSGPLRTSRRELSNPLAVAFVEAAQQYGLAYRDDYNGDEQEGVGRCDSTIADSRRSSSSSAYLHPVLDRPNLTVLTGCQVRRVLVEGTKAVGVELGRGRERRTIHADREVILAGGAVNSPQLLQLSGIGNADDLDAVGVKAIHDLPGVGEGLQDHLAVGVQQLSTQPLSLMPLVKPVRAALALVEYVVTGGGPASKQSIEALAFVKTRAELAAPDIQYHFIMVLYKDHGRKIVKKHGFSPYFTLQRPESRGTVKLRSADPLHSPVIDPRYFTAAADRVAMREGIKIAREIIAQRAFDPYRGAEHLPGSAVTTDAEIDSFLRQSVESNYHLTGSCRMGADENAVVDDRLRVRGLDRLRVVDASVMPAIVSGNTNAATIMIAEKGADFILGKES